MDLTSSFSNLSVDNFPSKVQNFAAIISGVHTEFIYTHFPNSINLFVTQYGKIGNIYSVKADQPANGTCSVTSPVYTIRPLFGNDNIQIDVAIRYLAERLKITKPLLISLSLKEYGKSTLDQLASAVLCRNK